MVFCVFIMCVLLMLWQKPSSIVAGDGHTLISSGNEDIKKPGLFDDQDEDDDWFAPPPRQVCSSPRQV